MQVDPIKRTLKLTGTKRLELICDDPLSNFAFTFSLRHYNLVAAGTVAGQVHILAGDTLVRRCRLTPGIPC